MGKNEYTIDEILPWVRAILTGTEITVDKCCLEDFQRLAENINLYKNPYFRGRGNI